MIKYITDSGRFYVETRPIDGTYDIKEWPLQKVLANRDLLISAREHADYLEQEHPGGEAFCMYCKVPRSHYTPGRQGAQVCVCNPTEGGHRWVINA